MRPTIYAALLCLSGVILQGCVTASKEEVAGANFGPYPDNYQERVKTYESTQIRLRPETATYEFSARPRKGFYQAGLVGHKKRYGWIVPVKITVKNHFGFHVNDDFLVILFPDGTAEDCTEYFGELANFVEK